MSILTKLKSLFSKKTVTSPQTAKEKLEAKSSGAVTAIRTIINTLKDASTEIATEKASNVKKMEELAEENKFYDNLEATNGKIIANFENLLEKSYPREDWCALRVKILHRRLQPLRNSQPQRHRKKRKSANAFCLCSSQEYRRYGDETYFRI